jgi:alpha-glucuronidase
MKLVYGSFDDFLKEYPNVRDYLEQLRVKEIPKHIIQMFNTWSIHNTRYAVSKKEYHALKNREES